MASSEDLCITSSDSIEQASLERQTTAKSQSNSSLADIDDATILSDLVGLLRQPTTGNFLVTFNDDVAGAVVDASCPVLESYLIQNSSPGFSTRWLHIFKPAQHRSLLEALGTQYDFAPRLLAEMCSSAQTHEVTMRATSGTVSKSTLNQASSFRSWESPATHVGSAGGLDSELSSSLQSLRFDRKNTYQLASEIWHYTTIDFGRNYICCGYNTLHGVAPVIDNDVDGDYHLPSCTRVWNWLVICDDGTVISIMEDILPTVGVNASPLQARLIHEIRRNILNVFQSLSTLSIDPMETCNRATLLPIRARLGSSPEETLHHEADSPGLLFFYIFENWQNSYTLLTRKESRYGVELERLRKQMLVQPRLGHIDRLHRIGQELGVLKRHYDSCNSLIERLLAPRPITAASLQNSRVIGEALREEAVQTSLPKESSVGVSLSTATRVRLQRLHDQVQLYALSEIDEYLTQKDSLISLNFNLLTLRESLDVEKLTRITLLLTKSTILFLPVSFMASYFSLQLSDTQYTVTQFWLSFAIILALSWLLLYTFGIISGTAQTSAVFGMLAKAIGHAPSMFHSRQTSSASAV